MRSGRQAAILEIINAKEIEHRKSSVRSSTSTITASRRLRFHAI